MIRGGVLRVWRPRSAERATSLRRAVRLAHRPSVTPAMQMAPPRRLRSDDEGGHPVVIASLGARREDPHTGARHTHTHTHTHTDTHGARHRGCSVAPALQGALRCAVVADTEKKRRRRGGDSSRRAVFLVVACRAPPIHASDAQNAARTADRSLAWPRHNAAVHAIDPRSLLDLRVRGGARRGARAKARTAAAERVASAAAAAGGEAAPPPLSVEEEALVRQFFERNLQTICKRENEKARTRYTRRAWRRGADVPQALLPQGVAGGGGPEGGDAGGAARGGQGRAGAHSRSTTSSRSARRARSSQPTSCSRWSSSCARR